MFSIKARPVWGVDKVPELHVVQFHKKQHDFLFQSESDLAREPHTSCSLLRNSFPTAAESLVERHQVRNHRCAALREIVFGSELLTLRIQHTEEV